MRPSAIRHVLRHASKLHQVFAVLGLFLFLLASSAQDAQTSLHAERLSGTGFVFDVASVRESSPRPPYSQYVSNPPELGRFDATDIWINQVIGDAYDLNYRYQIVNGPEWLGQQRFTIHAKSDTRIDKQLKNLPLEAQKAAKQAMLQHLLEDRFGLKCHIEMRETSVYLLTRSKATPGLHEVAVPENGAGKILTSGTANNLSLIGHEASMQQLSALMSFYLKTQVVDQTGLEKTYDFNLRFNAHPDLVSEAREEAPIPQIALAEQLGLKLSRSKGTIRIVVIDKIDKPSVN